MAIVRVHCHCVQLRTSERSSCGEPAMRPPRTRKKSFVHKLWAIRTAALYKVVTNLSERVWGEIHEASSAAIAPVDVDATADDGNLKTSYSCRLSLRVKLRRCLV